MTTPKVGLTHDIVVYPTGSSRSLGLLVEPYSYRVGDAPDFVPRMAIGDPRGLDYSSAVSWVQTKWDGRSGLDENDGHGYRKSVGLLPAVPDGTMYAVCPPPQFAFGYYTSPVPWSMYQCPIGKLPAAVHNVYSTFHTKVVGGVKWNFAETRIPVGRVILQPMTSVHPMQLTLFVANTLDRYIYSAVEYSTVMFMSTYYISMHPWGFREVGNVVAQSGNTLYTPVGTTTAGVLSVYDQKLWRSQPWADNIAFYRPQEATLGMWSGWTNIKPGIHILAMTEFIGRLMIGATTGLFAYESGRSYNVVDLSSDESSAHFSVMKVVHGALYFNVNRSLFRYTSGGLLEELDITTSPDEMPLDIVPGDRCVLLWAGNIETGKRSVYRIDLSYGSTQVLDFVGPNAAGFGAGKFEQIGSVMPSMFRVPLNPGKRMEAGAELSPLVIAPIQTSNDANQYTMTVFNDPLTVIQAPVALTTGAGSFAERFVETGLISLGYPKLYKSWQSVKVEWAHPQAFNVERFGMKYRTSRYSTWVDMGEAPSLPDEKGFSQVTFTFDPVATSQVIELRPSIRIAPTSSTLNVVLEPHVLYPVELRSVELDGLFVGGEGKGRRRRDIRCSVVASEPLELLTGEVENSLAYINQTLWSLFDSGTTHVVALPYPAPVGHTVRARIELGESGVAVPVLAYSNHQVYNIGSSVPLRILEV